MFRRIANLFRGFLSLFVSGMEKRNPEALLEVERENLRTQIARYNARNETGWRHFGNLERDIQGQVQSPQHDIPGLLHGDGRAVARNDAAALQVRDEVNIMLVVGQHAPCGLCIGMELGTARDFHCVGVTGDADRDRCRSGAVGK